MEEKDFYVEFAGIIAKVYNSGNGEKDGDFSLYIEGSRVQFNKFKCFLGEAKVVPVESFDAKSESINSDTKLLYDDCECIIVPVKNPNSVVFVYNPSYCYNYEAITIYTGAEFDKNSDYTKENILPKIKIVKR